MLWRFFSNLADNTPMSEIVIHLVTMVAAVLICLVVHELCHGLASYALGDQTAKRMGRLSLNPVRHIDPIGSLMLLFVGFGWAKPVQVDPRYFRNPKRDMALTALAGPFSNFILAFLAAGGLKLVYDLPGIPGDFIFFLFLYTAFYSTALGVFNLIPIPPLDGSKILAAFLPERAYWMLMKYERYGMFVLLFLAMTGSLRAFLNDFIVGILSLLFGIFNMPSPFR